jgi:hypothetical protein
MKNLDTKAIITGLLLFMVTVFAGDTRLAARDNANKINQVRELHTEEFRDYTQLMSKVTYDIAIKLGENTSDHASLKKDIALIREDIAEIKGMIKEMHRRN